MLSSVQHPLPRSVRDPSTQCHRISFLEASFATQLWRICPIGPIFGAFFLCAGPQTVLEHDETLMYYQSTRKARVKVLQNLMMSLDETPLAQTEAYQDLEVSPKYWQSAC